MVIGKSLDFALAHGSLELQGIQFHRSLLRLRFVGLRYNARRLALPIVVAFEIIVIARGATQQRRDAICPACTIAAHGAQSPKDKLIYLFGGSMFVRCLD
jgi:hypothetical protein